MNQSKELYRTICKQNDDIPLFMQAWWLDAATAPDGKEWDVFLCEEKGKIIGAMPYHPLKKWGFTFILQPQLTQYNGVWIDYPKEIKLHKCYSFEKKVMDNLIDQLEKKKWSFYSQNFYHSFKNWQPFYWRDFRQTTRYTYQIKDLSNLEKVFDNFSYAKQKHIKKDSDDLLIEPSLSANEFYDFHERCLLEKNARIAYSRPLFLSLCNEAIKREQGKIIALKDRNQHLHAALFFVWDKNAAYALISAVNPQFKAGGASTKMFWEAMKFVSDKTKVFDFEGSMIQGVAQSFQQFGAEQVPYFSIKRINSAWGERILAKLNFIL
ncbi:MAG: hypothetical protein LBR75_01590 [Prevotellaceae bacterium]|jgi:hypothetical protein|nr:hypothetical protein [Prevotellaceae bacterium]